MGHSMGGHGALTIALRNLDRYADRSRSINETCARDWLTPASPCAVTPQEEERRRISHLYSGLLALERTHAHRHPARPPC